MERIDTKTARERLPVRGRPYFLAPVATGITLGYRRLKAGAGKWVVRKADGKGGDHPTTFATADDVLPADGTVVLDYDQALVKAREVALGHVFDDGKPLTVVRALDDFAADLLSRESNPQNATRVRGRLPAALLDKPVTSLNARELKRWRDDLLTKVTRPTAVRTIKMLRAALNLAADHDSRVTNRNEWKVGLKTKDDYRPVDQVLEDDQVQQLIAAAYGDDYQFGLLLEVLAQTGTRTKQACCLTVGDLQTDKAPRLMMPTSRKGKYRAAGPNRSVPITPELAAKLRVAAGTRPRDAALLLASKGSPWNPRDNVMRKKWDRLVADCGITGQTMYALRHSFITRSLKANIPASVVANSADTSVAMIEKTYGAFVADHADEIMRRGLLGSGAMLRLVPKVA
jgi:integrase